MTGMLAEGLGWTKLDGEHQQKIDQNIKKSVIFESDGPDPAGIRRHISGKFHGVETWPMPETREVQTNFGPQTITSGTPVLNYFREEEKPRPDEPPINTDTHITSGGSITGLMIIHKTHYPNAFFWPSKDSAKGMPCSEASNRMKRTGESLILELDFPFPHTVIVSVCNENSLSHAVSMRDQNKCWECEQRFNYSVIPF